MKNKKSTDISPKERISFFIESEHAEYLRNLSIETRVPISNYLRDAMDLYMASLKAKKP
jgi:hypothetical protein